MTEPSGHVTGLAINQHEAGVLGERVGQQAQDRCRFACAGRAGERRVLPHVLERGPEFLSRHSIRADECDNDLRRLIEALMEGRCLVKLRSPTPAAHRQIGVTRLK